MDSLRGRRKRGLSPEKAEKMLQDNSANGRPLTPGQRGLFGLIAGGGTPTRTKSAGRRKKRGRQSGY